jgi:uncharacterized membrane protein YphA (DoxX/SURF4 family)
MANEASLAINCLFQFVAICPITDAIRDRILQRSKPSLHHQSNIIVMKKKILFVLCLLVGLLFVNAGLNKFFNYLPPPADLPKPQTDMFMAMVQIGWLLPVVAVAEIVGGVLFTIPRFRALGAIILCPVLLGIIATHLTVAPEGLPMAVVIAAIWIWALVEHRKGLMPLIRTENAI